MCTCCGAVFQRPNPLKSHIRHHCSTTTSRLSTVPDTSRTHQLWTHANVPPLLPLLPPPAIPWWLHGCPAAVWNSAHPPLDLTTPSPRGGNLMTSYADDVTGNARSPAGAHPAAGMRRWLHDYLQRLLRSDDDSGGAAAATRTTAKLRDVTTSDDVTNSTMTSSERVPAADKRRGGYACPYCGKSYSRRYGLKIHVRTHTGYKPLRCSVCERAFGDPSNLNKHVRLHAAQTQAAESDSTAPYRCRHCGKVLVRRRDLDRHVRARHGADLPFPPSSCDVSSNGADTALVTSSECVSADDDDDDDDDDEQRGRLAGEAEVAT